MTNIIKTIKPEDGIAIAKTIDENNAAFMRSALPPGQFNINTAFRLYGSITVGEDFSQSPTRSIPLIESIALFWRYSGVTGEHAAQALVRSIHEAITLKGKAQGEVLAHIQSVAKQIEAVKTDIIAKLPKTTTKGQVRAKLSLEPIA